MKLTQKDALVIQLALIREALAITFDKRADYSSADDPYQNYREGNDLAGIEHAWQYAMRRNMEKFTRRKNIMLSANGRARSADDSFVDAARDSINLVHIEFGLELEEMGENGKDLLFVLEKRMGDLPELISQFLGRIGAWNVVGSDAPSTNRMGHLVEETRLLRDGD